MKHLTLGVLVMILLLSGCDKERRNGNRMDGTWNIYSYTQISGGGFQTHYPATGTISFEDQGEGYFKYQENFTFDSDTGLVIIFRKGEGVLLGERALAFEINFTEPQSFTGNDGVIYLVTKDALKIEYRENDRRHRFVLQKN